MTRDSEFCEFLWTCLMDAQEFHEDYDFEINYKQQALTFHKFRLYGSRDPVTIKTYHDKTLLLRQGIEPNPGPRGPLRRRNMKKKRVKKTKPEKPVETAIVPAIGASPSVETFLRYLSETKVQNVAASFFSTSFNINNTYDPKGTILTESLILYNTYTEMFIYNRVMRSLIDFTASNLEATTITLGLVVSIATPLVPTSQNEARDFIEGPMCYRKLVMAPQYSYKSTVHTKVAINMEKMYGDQEYNWSSLYSAVRQSSPSTIIFLNIVGYTASGAALSSGFEYTYEWTPWTKFYGRSNPMDNTFRKKLELARRIPTEEELNTMGATKRLTNVCSIDPEPLDYSVNDQLEALRKQVTLLSSIIPSLIN
jgi:hypothetical protein